MLSALNIFQDHLTVHCCRARNIYSRLYAQDSSPLLWDRCSLTERICIRTDIPAGPSIDRFCCVGHTIACWPEHSPRSWSLIGVDFALCAIRRVFSVSLSAINSSHHFIICTQSHYAWHDVSIRNTTLRTLASFRGIFHPRKSTRTKLQVASVQQRTWEKGSDILDESS